MQNIRSLQQPSIAGRNKRRKEREDNVEPLFQRTRDLHFLGPKVQNTQRPSIAGRNRRRKKKEDKLEPQFQGRQGILSRYRERNLVEVQERNLVEVLPKKS